MCGRPIFAATARATGGVCRPCLRPRAEPAAEDLHERDAPAQLSAEQFETVAATADVVAACHLVFEKAHTKWSRHGHEALNTGERTVIAVETFFGETCNGGLIQFLGNESGAFAQDLPEALMRVGLTEYVSMALALRRAFPNGIPRDPGERWAQVEALEDDQPTFLDELTEQFFARHSHDEVEDFRERLVAYIRANRDELLGGPAA